MRARRLGAAIVAAAAVVTTVAGAPTASGQAAPDPVVYVALGDSFTSGPLVLPHDTSRVPQDCGQSTRNYPHLVAQALGVAELRDVSCGSATIDDLYEPQDGLPLGGVNAAQFDALGPEVDIVTIGISGNDVGFSGMAIDCVRLFGPPLQAPCSPAFKAGGVDLVSQRIAEVGVELGQALRDLQVRAPNADVFVVGYPTSLPHNAVACWPYLPILQADMPYLVAKFKEMNAMVAEQAAANGATYVDIYTSSIGHDACKLPLIAWVNGIVIVPLSFPAHPNEFGLANSARVVTQTIRAHG